MSGLPLIQALLALVLACGGTTTKPAAVRPVHPVYAGKAWPYPHQCGPLQSHVRECFVHVPAGEVLTGAQSSDPSAPGYDVDARPDEAPVHQHAVPAFYMQLREVSAEHYGKCLAAGACKTEHVMLGAPTSTVRVEGRERFAANGVSWHGASAYCAWIGARLPTEREWERAARGSDGRRYPWGDRPRCAHTAESKDGVPTRCEPKGPVHPDEVIGASAMGLRDMGSSLWEWTADARGEERIQRGGSWADEDPRAFRSAARASLPPDARFDDVGFRCALDDLGTLISLNPGSFKPGPDGEAR